MLVCMYVCTEVNLRMYGCVYMYVFREVCENSFSGMLSDVLSYLEQEEERAHSAIYCTLETRASRAYSPQ